MTSDQKAARRIIDEWLSNDLGHARERALGAIQSHDIANHVHASLLPTMQGLEYFRGVFEAFADIVEDRIKAGQAVTSEDLDGIINPTGVKQ